MKLPKLLIRARLNATPATPKWAEQVTASNYSVFLRSLGSLTNCKCNCRGKTGPVDVGHVCGDIDTLFDIGHPDIGTHRQ